MSLPNNIVFKSLGEVAGTFILVSVILMITSANKPNPRGAGDVAIPIGIALIVAIYMFGDLSGGHFNPAVSMTMFLKDQASFGPLMLAIYIVAQMVGGVVALQWNSITSLSK